MEATPTDMGERAWQFTPGAYVAKRETEGTLHLSKTGRLSFTFTSGRVLFSAPVALITYMAKLPTGKLYIMVGDRDYMIVFYKTDVTGALAPTATLGQAALTRGTLKKWDEKIKAAATMPADNDPIVANRFELPAQKKVGLFAAFLAAFIVAPVVTAFAVQPIESAGLQKFIVILVVIIMAAIFIGVSMRNKRRMAADPGQILGAGQPDYILPAGTKAKDFSFANRHSGVTATLIVIGAIFGVLVMAMVIAVVLGMINSSK